MHLEEVIKGKDRYGYRSSRRDRLVASDGVCLQMFMCISSDCRDREDLLVNYRAAAQQAESLQAAVNTIDAERYDLQLWLNFRLNGCRLLA